MIPTSKLLLACGRCALSEAHRGRDVAVASTILAKVEEMKPFSVVCLVHLLDMFALLGSKAFSFDAIAVWQNGGLVVFSGTSGCTVFLQTLHTAAPRYVAFT